MESLENGPVPSEGNDEITSSHRASRRHLRLLARWNLHQLEATGGRPILKHLDGIQHRSGGVGDNSDALHVNSQITERGSTAVARAS
jgi:hypothetical protein